MTIMNEEKLARFEANIERLVESAFANFFGKKVYAQDIALQLARSMEDRSRPGDAGDPRPIAPDYYAIELNPYICTYLTEQQPGLQQSLSQHLVMLAAQTGYRLTNIPIVQLLSQASLERNQIVVAATHTNRPENSTVGMQRVEIQQKPASSSTTNLKAQLLVNSERAIALDSQTDLINIGRQQDNDVVLDDPYISRHHIQIRRRFHEHILFDIHSQGGTFVNGVRIKEHRLQSGDVIQIGRSHIVYLQDPPPDDTQLAQTDAFEPLV